MPAQVFTPGRACRTGVWSSTRAGHRRRRPGLPRRPRSRRAGVGLVFVPGYRFPDHDDPPQAVVDALSAAHDRGARLAAISTGAFAIAATGLLDGRRATTHWNYTRALAEKHPLVRVDENVLFVDEGSVLTSAGAASGIDLCLHILRGDPGVAASNHAPRRLVAAPTAAAVRRSMCRAAYPRSSASSSPPPANGPCTGSTNPSSAAKMRFFSSPEAPRTATWLRRCNELGILSQSGGRPVTWTELHGPTEL
ncbi:AraC family transcriptional regulator [Streptomyces sp. NPDC059161]|uniref:AraC family transcriptional regulator n=1 Tax=Streptomyces sp. NPDC059161 TaxID=3346749 RepID=UPI0036B7C299